MPLGLESEGSATHHADSLVGVVVFLVYTYLFF
jgi:hypothetical protein